MELNVPDSWYYRFNILLRSKYFKFRKSNYAVKA